MPSPDDYRRGASRPRVAATAAVQDSTPLKEASPSRPTAPASSRMFSRAYDGWAVGRQWLDALARNDDTVLQREGRVDLKLFEALLDDDTAFTAFQQRRLALIERPIKVEPGNADDPRSVQAADDLRDMLNAVGWDRVCDKMMFGRWFGYAVGEGMFEVREHNGRQLIWLADIIVPDRAWFGFTNAGELRMRTPGDADGVAVPDNKFWTYRAGASHDFAPYGTGLAHWCYWPVWFKRNVLQFWALYLEKFGQPTAVGYFQQGASQDDIAALVQALKAIGTDSAVALPAPPTNVGGTGAGVDLRPSLMEATRGGSGAESYRDFVAAQDDAILRVVMGQSGTAKGVASGLNSNQADVHQDVAHTIVKADSDELHDGFNRTFAVWLTRWNHGPDVAPPTVFRDMDDAEDIGETAKRDAVLDEMGWRRTDESFRETYGDGYERKPEPVPPPMMPGARGNGGPAMNANDNTRDPADRRAVVFAAGDPRPLYISRKLLNGAEVRAHFERQGVTGLVDAADMHVTVCYSRNPVDWFDMPEDWAGDEQGRVRIKRGGPRAVEVFGADAVVLMFASRELRWRHEALEEAGASHDWPEYRPHVTIAKGEQSVDLATVEPWDGDLRFGPEIWEPLDADPVPVALTHQFSAEELDQVDRLTAELVADASPEFAAMGEALRGAVERVTANGAPMTPESLRLAMLQAWETMPIDALARRMALPFTAERAAAAAGVEQSLTA